MPRIDPEQLLKCLGVLLSPHGGIKSVDEVTRLVTLMLRFSKKLVSKCIYINILTNTETEILGSFMTAGGWSMTLTWLNEGIVAKNWPLVEEILKLLFLCPVDVERLKSNTFPRKVKALSKDASHPGVQYLATCLVERWLKIVKGETVHPLVASEIPVLPPDYEQGDAKQSIEDTLQFMCSVESIDEHDSSSMCGVNQDPKTINETISSVVNGDVDSKSDIKLISNNSVESNSSVLYDESNSNDSKHSHKSNDEKRKREHKSSKKSSHSDKSRSEKSNRRSDEKSNYSRSSSHSSHHKSKSSTRKDHDKKDKDSSRKDTSSSSSNSSSREKETDNEKSKVRSSDKHKDKDRHKSSESKSHSDASKSKDKNSSKSSEKSISKLKTVSINDLGKIPKKSHSSVGNEVKKNNHSISIEVRKPTESGRPKTVKTFNSKFRSHGLEEEAKPPPPRGQAKKPTTALPTIPPVVSKRTSPIRSADAPPEKKVKVTEVIEKPGAIKLIPAKPKPAFLQESVMFMDALTASANSKTKKKKRKLSISKDTSQDASPPTSPTTPTSQQTSPSLDLPKSAPFRFYQDTLDSEDNKEGKEQIKEEVVNKDVDMKDLEKDSDSMTMKSPLMSPPRRPKDEIIESSIDTEQISIVVDKPNVEGGLRSILTLNKVKGAKKSLRWRDTNLEEVQYFELDENERVNVTRTFLDMKQMERIHEREAFQKARNLINDDLMGEQTTWRPLIPIDAPEIDYGKNSREKDVQLARQKSVLQCLYLNKGMVPDSAAEPDHEQHQVTDPVIIPLDDISGSGDNVEDLSDRPWPEPKPYGPPTVAQGMPTPPNIYNPIPPFGPPGFQNPSMPGPMFPPGPAMPGDWPMNGPNMMMPNGMNGPPEMFMVPGSGPMLQPPMNNDFPMMENMNGPMFPPGFPGPMGNMGPNGPMMNRPMGPNGPNGPPFGGFPGNRGNGNRGPVRGGGGGGPWRGKGNWNGPPRGGNNNVRGNSKRCIHFQKKGYCRQENNCHFAHY